MRLKKLLFFCLLSTLNIDIFASTEKLKLEPGFKISVFADNLDSPRQMVEGSDGTIFLGQRSGQILALVDSDNNGQVDSQRLLADKLTYSTGVSIFEGDLYFSEISKIWKIENIEDWLKQNLSGLPIKILVTANLPKDKWHGWKCLKNNKNG